jgi:hypothetical protein
MKKDSTRAPASSAALPIREASAALFPVFSGTAQQYHHVFTFRFFCHNGNPDSFVLYDYNDYSWSPNMLSQSYFN